MPIFSYFFNPDALSTLYAQCLNLTALSLNTTDPNLHAILDSLCAALYALLRALGWFA